MATAHGRVKKTALDAFGKRGSGGIIAIKLEEGDQLIRVRKTTGEQEIVLATRNGRAIRFDERDVRPMGRAAAGVRGIRLQRGDQVVDMALVQEAGSLLTVCENGYGKRSAFAEYPCRHRGGQGVLDIKTTRRNGHVVSMQAVDDDDELMIITQNGMMLRTDLTAVREIGRATQGVRMIRLEERDKVVAVAKIASEEDSEANSENHGDRTLENRASDAADSAPPSDQSWCPVRDWSNG